MIRNAPRRRILCAVVVALVGVLAAPVDECDDYAFLHAGAATAHAGESDSEECHHVCSCLVCVLTTDDSFAPDIPSPQSGDAVPPLPVVLTYSEHLPEVYRPPIA